MNKDERPTTGCGGCGSIKPRERGELIERFLELPVPARFRTSVADFLKLPRFPPAIEGETLAPRKTSPEEVATTWDAPPQVFSPGSRPIYLTQARVDLRGVQHRTRGLEYFENPLEEIVTNTFIAEARSVTVCLRFFLLDECGRDRAAEAPGILAEVTYPAYAKAPHLGRLSKETTDKIEAIVAEANRIWGQCVLNQIQFEIATNPDDGGKRFYYALDPQAVRATQVTTGKVKWDAPNGMGFMLELVRNDTYDLCQLFDGGTGRNITLNNGSKSIKRVRTLTYGDNRRLAGVPIPPLADFLEQKGLEPTKTEEIEGSALAVFGLAADGAHGERCVNIFVAGEFEDTGEPEDELALSQTPGRNSVLDESVVTDEDGNSLAHELGHILSLKHADNEQNLMHESSHGEKIEEEEKAGDKEASNQCQRAFAQALTIPGSRSSEDR